MSSENGQSSASVDRVVLRSIERRRGDATIRATWPDGLRMMFGTSYRTWWDQLREYCRLHKRERPSIEVSSEPWIGYGGLKWCEWSEFQGQLDIEAAGRSVDDFRFRIPNRIEANCMKSVFGDA